MLLVDRLLSFISLLLGMLILALPTTIIALPKGGILVFFMLVLSLVGLMLHRVKVRIDAWEKYFVLSFSLYFVVVALGVWWFDGNLNDIDTPSRLILVMPIFFLIRKLSIDAGWLMWGVVAASAIIGINQLMLKLLGYSLYDFQDNSGIATLYASIFGLSSLFFIHKGRSQFLNLIFYVAALLGVSASLLLGGRGVWISAFLSILVILFLNPMAWQSRIKFISFISLLCLVLAAYFVHQTNVKNRVDLAITNVSDWVETGNSNTSGGARLEMWKSAYKIIKLNPFIGVGEGNYAKHNQELIEQGEVDQVIGSFNHPHSEYFSSLVEQGVFGFIAFLLVLLVPIKQALYSIKANMGCNDRVPIILTMVIVLHYTFYSITSVVFGHQSTTLFYATFISISLGLLRAHSERKA